MDGPHGIFSNKYVEITENLMNLYRNQGGFDMIGSGILLKYNKNDIILIKFDINIYLFLMWLLVMKKKLYLNSKLIYFMILNEFKKS